MAAPEPAELREHLAHCGACAREAGRLRAAEAALRAVAREAAPEDLLADFHRRLRSEAGRRRAPAWGKWLPWASAGALATAAAAAVLLWVGPLGNHALQSTRDEEAEQQSVQQMITPPPAGEVASPLADAEAKKASRNSVGGSGRAPVARTQKPAAAPPAAEKKASAAPPAVQNNRRKAVVEAEAESAGPGKGPARLRKPTDAKIAAAPPAKPATTATASLNPQPAARALGGRREIAAAKRRQSPAATDASPVVLAALRRPVTVALQDAPLSRAVERLSLAADVSIRLQPANQDGKAMLQARQAPLWLALEQIARQNGLVIAPDGNELILRRPARRAKHLAAAWSGPLAPLRAAEFAPAVADVRLSGLKKARPAPPTGAPAERN